MPKVSRCLRCGFISFSLFCLISGGLVTIISLDQLSPSLDGVLGGNEFQGQMADYIVRSIAGSVTMAIAIIGLYGAINENLVALIVFLVCAVISSMLTLRAVVSAAVAHASLENMMEDRLRSFLPLDQASDNVKNQAEALQASLHCCGLFSSEDWEQNIPDSCLCQLAEEGTGDECQTVDYQNFLLNLLWQKKSVFKQSCSPFIMDAVTAKANILLGSVIALMVLALLGSLFSSLIVCQMFHASNWLDRPPAYQQLYYLQE